MMATDWLMQRTDPNTTFNSYDPRTGQWSAGTNQGWSIYEGLAPMIEQYLRNAGYSGRLDNSETFNQWNLAQGNQFGRAAYGFAAKDADAFRAASEEAAARGLTDPNTRNTDLDAWLQSQGLGLQYGVQQTPGASQKTWIQRLVDAQGNPVVVDAHNDRYSARDRMGDLALATAVAMGGYGAMTQGLGGAGAGTQLGAGATGAGAGSLTTQGIGAAELAGLGLSNPAPLSLAPSFGAGAGLTTAGITAADLGGLSSAGLEAAGFANPIAYAPGVEGLGSFATLGGGAATPQVSTPGLGAETTQGLGLSNPGALKPMPSWEAALGGASTSILPSAGSGLLDTIKNSPIGKGVGAVADLVGGGGNLAAIVGGALGATQGGKTDTATVSRNLDPRIDAALFGNGGYLSQLQQQFNATKGGNADMTAGADMLRNLYQSPQYAQGYEQMRSVGQGLLGQGVAANPFTNPSSAPAGLLGAFQPVARGQMPTGLLPVPTRRGSV